MIVVYYLFVILYLCLIFNLCRLKYIEFTVQIEYYVFKILNKSILFVSIIFIIWGKPYFRFNIPMDMLREESFKVLDCHAYWTISSVNGPDRSPITKSLQVMKKAYGVSVYLHLKLENLHANNFKNNTLYLIHSITTMLTSSWQNNFITFIPRYTIRSAVYRLYRGSYSGIPFILVYRYIVFKNTVRNRGISENKARVYAGIDYWRYKLINRWKPLWLTTFLETYHTLNCNFSSPDKGSRKKKLFLNGRAIKAIPPPPA